MIKNAPCWIGAVLIGCAASETEHPRGFQGVVELEETVLAFETAGRVQQVRVEEGDAVSAGMLLADLDDELIRATRASRVLEVEVARAEADVVGAAAKRDDVAALAARLRAAEASEALLTKSAARQRRLFESNAVPEASVEDTDAQLARARAERESIAAELASLQKGARREERKGASARAQAAEAALAVEDERLERHRLTAAVAGRVLDVHVEPGEIVAAGAPVVTLGDTRRPFVDVFVPQASLRGVSVGRQARIRVDAEAQSFHGRVEHVARRTEFTPRFLFSERERPNLVVRVRVRVEDASERLHAGVPAFVTLEGAP